MIIKKNEKSCIKIKSNKEMIICQAKKYISYITLQRKIISSNIS